MLTTQVPKLPSRVNSATVYYLKSNPAKPLLPTEPKVTSNSLPQIHIFLVFELLLELFKKRYLDDDFLEEAVKFASQGANRHNLEGLLTLITYDIEMFSATVSYSHLRRMKKCLRKVSTPNLWVNAARWNVSLFFPTEFFKLKKLIFL